MKKIAILIFFLPLFLNAQTFTLADSLFKINAIYRSQAILFEYDKANLKEESFVFLDSFAAFMQKYPTLVIEVGNHRDSRSSDEYGSKVTQKRAQAVVSYLISKGISKERLVAKGYGDTMPLIPDEKIAHLKSEEEIDNAHSQNRRTEFKILSL